MRTAALAVLFVLAVCVRCGAAPPELWFYQATNLQVDKNADDLEKLWRRAAEAGYSKVLLADSKVARLGDLGEMRERYFANARRVRGLGRELGIEIVPAVFGIGYSNALLWHDPNLAEGLPVRDSLFVVRGGRAALAPDPAAKFEKVAFVDENVRRERDVATVENNAGNARLCYALKLPQYRCYHVSVWVRTEGFTGQPEIKALGGEKGKPLQFQNLGVARTQEWKEHHVVFNTLDQTDVRVYFGVWGGAKGKLQWRDWKIEEVGLVNVLNRDGAPLSVRIEGGRALVVGKDFDPPVDPRMGTVPWNGAYESFHAPPPLVTHGLADGTRLRVSWYHPAIIYDEQVAVCLSDPKLEGLLADEARRVRELFGNASFMMSHDELRVANQDEVCRERKLTAGQLFAENVQRCRALLKGSHVYVWSDMFDPFHNAKDDYYLVSGSMAGSWEGLDRSVTVVNWNFGQRDKSLKFFADRGHHQVIAAYYDGPLEQVGRWLESAKGTPGVAGVMYTTSRGRYDDLERFAALVRGRSK